MNTEKIIFWNTDTQYDFMRDDSWYFGKLPVPNARLIEPNLKLLTDFARAQDYRIINTADMHTWDDGEISKTPDMINTYNMHCERGTAGAQFIPATEPVRSYVVDFRDKDVDVDRLRRAREITLYKNKFDVYDGNLHTSNIINLLDLKTAIHYGVALNVCVDQAIMGNVKKGLEVIAVVDAMKDLTHLAGTPLDTQNILDKWQRNGVRLVTTEKILEELKEKLR